MSARQPPPEARLIASARKAMVPALSMARAAQRAGMSPTRWRQLETGIIRVRGHSYVEKAPPEKLAQMALVVGVTADDLAAAGRDDAAKILAALDREPAGDGNEELIRSMHWLTPDEQAVLLEQYRRRRTRRAAG